MFQSVALVCLTALAAAAPNNGKGGNRGPQYKTTSYQANFDDLGVAPAAVAPIGKYDGLNYEGIDLVTLGIDGTIVAGVIPKSSPNAGAFGATTMLTQGNPMIDTSGTSTVGFDFQQFYFGCVAGTVESVASAPVSCSITATGYLGSKKVASQTFSYNPGVAVTAPMAKATLNKYFTAIDKVTFSTTYSVSSGGATLLDNLSYITLSK